MKAGMRSDAEFPRGETDLLRSVAYETILTR